MQIDYFVFKVYLLYNIKFDSFISILNDKWEYILMLNLLEF